MKSAFGPQWEAIDLKEWAKTAVELDETQGLLDAAVTTVQAVRDLKEVLDAHGVPHSFGLELVQGAFTGFYGH